MSDVSQQDVSLAYPELEARYGRDHAFTILRTLERFEGILEARVARLSFEDRMQNVFRMMKENMQFQTRH